MVDEDRFDAIVVGAGCAGSTAAYVLASAGKSVLLVERGNYPGSKNMTGGRLYSHSLKKIFPDFEKDAPLERRITHEKISLVSEESIFTIDFSGECLRVEGEDSYSVLRGPFDQWLASKAEDAGAMLLPGITVDDLIVRDGRVCGIVAAGEEMEAAVTILCDGANSLLIEKAGLASGKPEPSEMAVCAKEVIQLSEEKINDRFGVTSGEGTAWMFAGDCTDGHFGGMFLYTNKDSISIGVVAGMDEASKGRISVPQMLEDFKNRKEIAPLIDGGTLVEYSGHLVPEGGLKSMPKLFSDGVMVAGDAAFQCVNLGYSVRGMDFAITAGEEAAHAAIAALEAGDTSASGLSSYQSRLEGTYVLEDMKNFQEFPAYMEWNHRIFDAYPQMVSDIMESLFRVDGKPQDRIKDKVMRPVKKIGIMQLAKDAVRGVKAL